MIALFPSIIPTRHWIMEKTCWYDVRFFADHTNNHSRENIKNDPSVKNDGSMGNLLFMTKLIFEANLMFPVDLRISENLIFAVALNFS